LVALTQCDELLKLVDVVHVIEKIRLREGSEVGTCAGVSWQAFFVIDRPHAGTISWCVLVCHTIEGKVRIHCHWWAERSA
jgi:hypothetical protein